MSNYVCVFLRIYVSLCVFMCIYSNGQLFMLIFNKCVKLGYIGLVIID